MKNYFFTSDHHFGHTNILTYANRPFSSVEEMDEALIARWNEVVRAGDQVYHLGDFCLRDKIYAGNILAHLNGEIFFIKGDHDRWMNAAYPDAGHLLPPLYTHKFPLCGEITLCHYALRSWPKSHYATWHLFGHHHGKLPPYGLSFDVGVDAHNFYPWSLEEIEEKMKTLRPIVDFRKNGG